VAQFWWVTGTHQHGREKSTAQSGAKTVEFVPKAELDRALEEVQRLREKNERLQREIERLQKELEEAHRAVKRQTAPFSRRKKKSNPKPNGRKSGAAHGQHHRRPIPGTVHEQHDAPLPERCPCGGPAIRDQIKPQYQEDIVRQKVVRQFNVEIGHCACCGKRLQGRHPLQTSDALDAAQVQVGPEALTLAVHLNKQLGISYGNTAAVLRMGYGLHVSRGGLCRAVARMGKKTEPTYQALVAAVRQEAVVWMDETGWKVDAVLRWMWVAVSPRFTVYAILPGRGFDQASALIGADYAGGLEHDGWRVYYQYAKALHQSCLSHIVRRCQDLVEIVSTSAAVFPLAVLGLLEKALAVRDRYQAGEISWHGQCTAAGRIESELDRLLDKNYQTEANRRLAKHLDHESPYLFTFLHCRGIEATNNRAERAIRPAVMARHLCGGSRTGNGARIQQNLTSVLQTCHKQAKDSFVMLVDLWRNPRAKVLELLPNPLAPPDKPKRSPALHRGVPEPGILPGKH
jgi:transposase